ncbi:MAG: hypothetical protein ABI240_12215 [Sphingomonas sp.]
MSDFALLLKELNNLEAVQAELAGIATRTDDARKHDLIQLRRKLASQIGEVGKVADRTLADVDVAFKQAYRDHFSRMRSAAALHQANWPAVRLGEDIDNYHISAKGVRQANREFVAWTRGAIDQLQKIR